MNRILIVDDKPDNLYMLRVLLAGHGYEVSEARHGAEALITARQSLPDLVISDLLMPVMDGYTLLRHWKMDARLKQVPFVVYTATYTEPRDERLALDLGADAFILKPTEPVPFMARLQEVLAQASRKDLPPARAPTAEAKDLLQDYGEVIIRKLEEKSLLLQQLNGELQRDIAERLRAESEVRESEARFRTLVEGAPDAIFVQSGGRFTYVNPAMLRLVGASRPEDLLGTEFMQRIAPEYRDAVHQRIRLQRETGRPAPLMDQEYVRLDEVRIPVESTAMPIRYQDRDAHIVFLRDITERRRAEDERERMRAQLLQAQRLESIGTLASGVAHEINNPVMGIMNYAELIGDRAANDPKIAELAREIQHETERIAAIVHNLLNFARQEKQAHSPACLSDIVEAVMSLVRTVMRHDQIAVEVDVPAILPKLKCRSQQIQQVMMNLLTNARDALNEKCPGYHADKKVTIAARVVEKGGRPWIRTTVEDRGAGIPLEIRDRIFDPFFTTKPREKGTGLGLAISHGVVNDHGGELWCESEVGRWTRFHVDLPVDRTSNLEPAGGATRDAE